MKCKDCCRVEYDTEMAEIEMVLKIANVLERYSDQTNNTSNEQVVTAPG